MGQETSNFRVDRHSAVASVNAARHAANFFSKGHIDATLARSLFLVRMPRNVSINPL